MASSKPFNGALAPSLVACLRFAVRLVRSDAKPLTICSKTTLGAMVVDAHQLAQQAITHGIDQSDPRRLLTKILPLEDQLSRLSFNDITWDSEGNVAQSLEMELQDVEERANASLLGNFCVLLTASASEGLEDVAESALLWFPRVDDDSNNSSKKYLLYVVPGRIKIVKSVAELVKKMMEEIPTLRSSSAIYRVWTLIEAKDDAKKKQKLALVMASPTIITEVREPTSRPAVRQTRQVETPEQHVVQSDRSSEYRAAEPARVHRRLQVQVCEEDLAEQPSMFNFSRVEHDTARETTSHRTNSIRNDASDVTVSSVGDVHCDGSIRSVSAAQVSSPVQVGSDSMSTITPEMCGSPVSQLQEKRVKAQTGASASHVHAPQKHNQREPTDGDEGWKSLDGEKRKAPLAPSAKAVFAESRVGGEATTRAVGMEIRPLAARDHGESIFQFTASRGLEHPLRQIDSQSSDEVRSAHEVHSEHNEVPDSQLLAPRTDDAAASEPIFVEVTDAVESKKKKKSARDHYRNKLGARGWWELEYQATKILQQQQQQEAQLRTAAVRVGDQFIQYRTPKKQSHARVVESALRAQSPASGKNDGNSRVSPTLVVVPAALVNESLRASTNRASVRIDTSSAITVSRKSTDNLAAVSKTSPTMSSFHQNTIASRKGSRSPRNVQVRHASDAWPPSPNVTSCPTHVFSARGESPLWVFHAQPANCAPALESAIENSSRMTELAPPCAHLKRAVSALRQSKVETERSRLMNAVPSAATAKEDVSPSRFRRSHSDSHEDEEDDTVLMATMVSQNQLTKDCDRDDLSEEDDPPLTRESPDKEQTAFRPFHSHGRVPIRQRQELKPRQWISTVDNSDEDANEPSTEPKHVDPIPENPTTTKPRGPPVVATFTAGSPVKSHDEATQLARQQKLTELRQKKIQQLQKARDDAMGKKKMQATPVPTTVAPPPTTSFSSALPTTHVGAGESFAMGGHHARVRKPSNRKLVQNAIEYTLLAGGSLAKERQAALHALHDSPCDNFIVLLKSAKELKFRALYEHHVERHRVVRVFSVASSSPPVLTDDVISQFFRYNSGKKEFAAMDGREFTLKTDACALVDQLVFKKKAAALTRLL